MAFKSVKFVGTVVNKIVAMANSRELPNEERAIVKELSVLSLSTREVLRIVGSHFFKVSRSLKILKTEGAVQKPEKVTYENLTSNVNEWLP